MGKGKIQKRASKLALEGRISEISANWEADLTDDDLRAIAAAQERRLLSRAIEAEVDDLRLALRRAQTELEAEREAAQAGAPSPRERRRRRDPQEAVRDSIAAKEKKALVEAESRRREQRASRKGARRLPDGAVRTWDSDQYLGDPG
jgi:hypothetical protein